MPKRSKELSAVEVARLREGLHAVGGVPGLYLQVRGAARSWILRAVIGGKRRDVGLGGYPGVTLAGAREKARQARQTIETGVDPVLAKEAARNALKSAQAASVSFSEAAQRFIDAKSAEWRNGKHRNQWVATLETYAYPVIGDLRVEDVGQQHVLQVLEPIWATKTETASRLRGRIESVLDWASARGFRNGDNPARWRGHLDKLLARPRKVSALRHHPALPIDELPGFIVDLRQREGIAARALEFAALTAARSGEVRGAMWAEIDLEGALWTVPGERMKSGREHRVPLSPAALKLLRDLPRIEGTVYVFPSTRGGPLSDMSLTAVMRRMGVAAVPHGLRSTFRDWAAERTTYPSEMAEMALAHVIQSKVEAAYRRGDLLIKRQQMMAAWAAFLERPKVSKSSVVNLKRA